MTPSQSAKSAGLSSLAEVSKMTGVSTQTLNNWFNEKRKLFDIVIAGCAAVKMLQKMR
jgi:AcrR family transcriptional regulator